MNKILVVDDDMDILALLKITLSINNYEVEGIGNWQHIDHTIASFRPDLILLDIRLGNADGREICKQLKAQKETQHIPVILFSANAGVEKTLDGCNAQAFIPKPYELPVLLSTIQSVIDESRSFASGDLR